jgi:hypothetical protein
MATPQEEIQRILNTLLTAEKVETALYARGLESGVLNPIDPDDLTYFQAATSEEFVHAQILQNLGARLATNTFFFPPNTFTDKRAFLDLIELLEMGGIGAYSAAIFHFSGDLQRPDLALLAARILGTEAEHRVLARVVNEKNPPDNFCIEPVPTLSFDEIARMFVPFLVPNPLGGQPSVQVPFPDEATVRRLANGNFCQMT